MRVKITKFEGLVKKVLRKYGYNAKDAGIISGALVYAQLRGRANGLAKLCDSRNIRATLPASITVKKESPVTALLDAGSAHSILAVSQATTLAIHKAQNHGIAIIGVKSNDSSSGALSYYAEDIAAHSLVGMIFATTPPIMAPAGSYEPLLGANPLAIAVPTNKEPLVLDMDTAAISSSSLHAAHAASQNLPEGIAYDGSGNPTTSPQAALAGAVRAFDASFKGSHLGLMIQILAGPLLGLPAPNGAYRGHTIIAINPKALGGTEVVEKYIADFTNRIKTSKRAPGYDDVTLPGEREYRASHTHHATGSVTVDEGLYKRLVHIIS